MLFRLKQLIVSIQYRVDQWLPKWIGVCVRNRCWPWRLTLDAVELHLADRCNMNCTGCAHFSPFAADWQADVSRVAHDLATLKSKFRGGVRHVNLLGGEPLLHNDVCGIIRCVRLACPGACITLVTNGILLLGEPAEFWETCRRERVRILVTLYEPMDGKRQEIADRCAIEKVPLRIQEAEAFFAKMVPDGSSDPRSAFRKCRKTTYCPYLREGRLYICAQSYHVRDFVREVRRAGMSIGDCADEGLDVHDPKLTDRQILAYLMTPGKVCKYCSDTLRYMKWSRGSADVRQWFRHCEIGDQ